MTTTKVVDLLRDGRGVYGIGVPDAIDHRELVHTRDGRPIANLSAIACGRDWQPPALILRPDMLAVPKPPYQAALQKITGGFRHGIFSHCIEEHLRKLIHYRMLHTAGLPWPPDDPQVRYWSTDAKQQARNRQIYHGLRCSSLAIINKLIGATIEAAADPDALKVARRFGFEYRYPAYYAATRSTRALQLFETFPALACEIYFGDGSTTSFEQFEAVEQARVLRRAEAIKLVERGARLRDVAALMRLPMALRRVRPGAVHYVSQGLCERPELLAHMPDSLPQMRFWLRVVRWAAHLVEGSDFAEWAAKNAMRIPGESINERLSLISDLGDWATASRKAHRFVVRPFSRDMSLRTVMRLSADWHEAVANNMDGPEHAFPAPWVPAAQLNGHDIVPITNSADLYREGAAMHHCVGTYADGVTSGYCYVYSVRHDGRRIATAQIVRAGDRPALAQIRGPCNALAPKEIVAAVRRWLRTSGVTLPDKPKPPELERPKQAELDDIPFGDLDDSIPF